MKKLQPVRGTKDILEEDLLELLKIKTNSLGFDFSNNILLDFTASYRVYYNSRIGISNWYSFHNQKDSFNR